MRSKTDNRRLFVILLAVFSIFSSPVLAKYSGGSGTAKKPYQIATVADLLALAANTNDYDKYFILTADINLAPNLPGGQIFTTAVIAPDINNSDDFDGVPFTGSFDGAGHTIANLTIDTNGATSDWVGLFGYSTGLIKNLKLENVYISDGNNAVIVGALAGQDDANIINCSASVTIVGAEHLYHVGGLIGYQAAGEIENCFSTGTVSSGIKSGNFGGLIGLNVGTVRKCFSTCDVTDLNESSYLGGLVGNNTSGFINDCYSWGNVTGTNGAYMGGLAGYSVWGYVNNCYSSGEVDSGGGSFAIGGLLGSGSAYRCYFLETSGTDNDIGEPLTDSEMKKQASFVGWDFIGEAANGTEGIWWINEGVSYPTLVQPVQVDKCIVTSGAKGNGKISFSGLLDASANDFNEANAVVVTVDSNSLATSLEANFPVNADTFKKNRFIYAKAVNGVKESFTYDLKNHKFKFFASNVDLSGLGCPITVTIEIGGYNVMTEMNETIVNGPKVPIPIRLMTGQKNTLRVDKVQAKQSEIPNSDQISVKGAFAIVNPEISMADRTSKGLVVTIASDSFTITKENLKAGNGKFTFSKAPVTENNAIAAGQFNFSAHSFVFTLKNADIVDSSVNDTVDFRVAMADFNEVQQIPVP